jgi:hypothetical protein
MTEQKELTYNQMAKIAEEGGCVLFSKEEWLAFTRKFWLLAEENKRLKKINEKYRKEKQ